MNDDYDNLRRRVLEALLRHVPLETPEGHEDRLFEVLRLEGLAEALIAEVSHEVHDRPLRTADEFSKLSRKAAALRKALMDLSPAAKQDWPLFTYRLADQDLGALITEIEGAAKQASRFFERQSTGEDPRPTKKNHQAYAVAKQLASYAQYRGLHIALGHNEENEPTSHFGKLVEEIFCELEIPLSWKRPAEEAVKSVRLEKPE